jgi:hypothetical protein
MADKKEKKKAGPPNITGKCNRALTYKAGMGRNAGTSLKQQLDTAGFFLAHPEKWPRIQS